MSMYIIVEAANLNAAKARVKTVMDSRGYPEHFSQFLFGDVNDGFANGRVIKNNIVLGDWGNGNFCFEVDENIVTEYGTEIEEEVNQFNDIYWCTAEQARSHMPGEIV